jgi:hypothetical protein
MGIRSLQWPLVRFSRTFVSSLLFLLRTDVARGHHEALTTTACLRMGSACTQEEIDSRFFNTRSYYTAGSRDRHGVIDHGQRLRLPRTSNQLIHPFKCPRPVLTPQLLPKPTSSQAWQTTRLLPDSDPSIVTDEHGISNALLHPATTPPLHMHNFNPVYAPGSSLARSSGFAWWAVTGIDGQFLASRRACGVYIYRSTDGLHWSPAAAHPVVTMADISYPGPTCSIDPLPTLSLSRPHAIHCTPRIHCTLPIS